MTWTRIGDDFNDRLDLLELSRSARLLWVEGYVWCNRVGTDGRIPRSQVRRFTDADPDLEIAELEQAGLWEAVEGDDAWQIDWSHQEKATTVKARVDLRNRRQALYRERLALHKDDQHRLCTADNCPERRRELVEEEARNVAHNKTSNVATSLPGPSLPAPKGAGRGRCPCGSGHRLSRDAADDERCSVCTNATSTPAPMLAEATG